MLPCCPVRASHGLGYKQPTTLHGAVPGNGVICGYMEAAKKLAGQAAGVTHCSCVENPFSWWLALNVFSDSHVR